MRKVIGPWGDICMTFDWVSLILVHRKIKTHFLFPATAYRNSNIVSIFFWGLPNSDAAEWMNGESDLQTGPSLIPGINTTRSLQSRFECAKLNDLVKSPSAALRFNFVVAAPEGRGPSGTSLLSFCAPRIWSFLRNHRSGDFLRDHQTLMILFNFV